MNAKKAKQLRKVAKGFKSAAAPKYEVDEKGVVKLNRFCQKALNKELKKSFK